MEQARRCEVFVPLQYAEARPSVLDGQEGVEGLEIARRVFDAQDARILGECRDGRRRKCLVRRLRDVLEENRQVHGLDDCLDVALLDPGIHRVVMRRADDEGVGAFRLPLPGAFYG